MPETTDRGEEEEEEEDRRATRGGEIRQMPEVVEGSAVLKISGENEVNFSLNFLHGYYYHQAVWKGSIVVSRMRRRRRR